MGPLVRRSWAPRGHTPVLLQRGRNRINVSVIAAQPQALLHDVHAQHARQTDRGPAVPSSLRI
jgi:hypothetical protein